MPRSVCDNVPAADLYLQYHLAPLSEPFDLLLND